MCYNHLFYLISSIFILSERTQSQDSRGPGVSSCCFYGFRNKADCGLSEVLITDTPKECTSMIYSAVNIDLNHKVSDHVSADNFKTLDKMLKSGKRMIVYYGRNNQAEWSSMLASESSNGGANSKDEMKGLKAFLDEHPKIAGIIIYGLHFDTSSSEFPTYSENFKVYLDVMRSTFPELIIGLDIFGIILIDQYNNPKFKWLDIKVIDPAVDFYAVTLEYFNDCSPDFRNTGTTPMNGSNTSHTLEILKDVLTKLSFPKEKTYFKFSTGPSTMKESDNLCTANFELMCKDPKVATDWCADTQLSFNEKGRYSEKYGAGFMANYVDFDDPDNCCNCEYPYPAFHALLDGFNLVSTKTCDSLIRH